MGSIKAFFVACCLANDAMVAAILQEFLSSCKSGECRRNADCTSGWCQGGLMHLCSGKCMEKLADGVPSEYVKRCASGVRTCSVCGLKQGKGRSCSRDSDCKKGLCCVGRGFLKPFTVSCRGECVEKGPQACPGVAAYTKETIKKGIQNGIGKFKKWSKGFAQCVNDYKDEVTKAKEEIKDSQGFVRANWDLEAMRAQIIGAARKSGGRRLSEEGESVHLPSGAFMHVNHVGRLSGALDEEEPVSEGRKLGVKCNKEKCQANRTITKRVKCVDYGKCRAGGTITGKAELEFVPDFEFEFDLKKESMTIRMDAKVSTYLGLKALAAGECEFERILMFPKMPKPLVATCFGPICITVTVQGRAKYGLKGKLVAKATAEHRMQYQMHSNYSLKLDDFENSEADKDTSTTTKFEQTWVLDARGHASAEVYAEVAPVISIIVTPGIWATFYPTVKATHTMFGAFHLQKRHPEWEDIGQLETPTITCNKFSAAKSPLFDSLDDFGEPGNCLASALSVEGYVNVVAFGPIMGLDAEAVTQMMETICTLMKQSVMAPIKTAAAGFQQVTGKIGEKAAHCFAGIVGSTVEDICNKTTESLLALKTGGWKFLNKVPIIPCTQVFNEAIGDGSCAANVRCEKQVDEDGKVLVRPSTPPVLEEGLYEWIDMALVRSCTNSFFVPNATSLEECQGKSLSQEGTNCGNIISWSDSEKACYCILPGQLCDGLPGGKTGALYGHQYTGLNDETEARRRLLTSQTQDAEREKSKLYKMQQCMLSPDACSGGLSNVQILLYALAVFLVLGIAIGVAYAVMNSSDNGSDLLNDEDDESDKDDESDADEWNE